MCNDMHAKCSVGVGLTHCGSGLTQWYSKDKQLLEGLQILSLI